ncbi:MAG: VWA domain-containing protein [Sedimentisphaerales bacterium]|nr:VWA domain-containing protein [Sedimentisphaerales bacterium]
MRTTSLIAGWAVMAGVLCGPALYAAESSPIVEVPVQGDKPLVQIAILLDTSGSMSGLIDQARTELWSLVNEFIFARQHGRQPEVQVALYEYGKSALAAEVGYVRQIVPLTTDLDKISEELFALQTNGGDEYCGWVIRDATAQLQWRDAPDDLKVIFIAGNEPFTQGPVDYRQACKAAVEKGIIVNTIHCGPEQQGVDGKWRHGAVLADGRYLNIDQNRQVVHIPAPQDKEIAELGVRLNQTYVAYGRQGQTLRERQAVQDRNAAQASPEAAVGRAVAKSSSNYLNAGWDLVDAFNTRQVDLGQIEPKDLPESMRTMSADERKVFVEAKAKERASIQAQIQQLNDARRRFIADEMNKRQGDTDTLGSAARQAIREQAQKKNYTFETPENTSPVEPNAPAAN